MAQAAALGAQHHAGARGALPSPSYTPRARYTLPYPYVYLARQAVPREHAFAQLSASDNVVAFTTGRYQGQPLVVRCGAARLCMPGPDSPARDWRRPHALRMSRARERARRWCARRARAWRPGGGGRELHAPIGSRLW